MVPIFASLNKLLSSARLSFAALAILIGVSALAEGAGDTASDQEEGPLVEVEPSSLLPSDITGIYLLIPYRNRRESWGQTISIGYSSYVPINYEPDVGAFNYRDVFGSEHLPLVETQFAIKKNLTIGSIGGELGVGIYKNESDSTVVSSSLELIPVRLGLNLYLDNLFFEPYVVPYVAGGVYTIFFDESHSAVTFKGNTQVAPYYSMGLAFQLNWADREAARISYLDSGIENSFLYLEARQLMASQAAADPDFSGPITWGAGVRLEF